MSNIFGSIVNGDPLIDFILCPTEGFLNALKASDPPRPAPKPRPVRALVDTGFKGALIIDKRLVADWNLKARNFSQIMGIDPYGGGYYDYYAWEADVAIRFEPHGAKQRNVEVGPIPASMIEFAKSNTFSAIIGCQVLQLATFIFDGPKATLKFAFRYIK